MLGENRVRKSWAEILSEDLGRKSWAEILGGIVGWKSWVEILGKNILQKCWAEILDAYSHEVLSLLSKMRTTELFKLSKEDARNEVVDLSKHVSSMQGGGSADMNLASPSSFWMQVQNRLQWFYEFTDRSPTSGGLGKFAERNFDCQHTTIVRIHVGCGAVAHSHLMCALHSSAFDG